MTAINYVETLRRLRDCRRDIRRIFAEIDILILPTKRDTAPTIQATIDETSHRPPSNTSAFNRFGTPAISVPCGFSGDSLPIGLEIVGPSFSEARVLAVAYAFQPSHRLAHSSSNALAPSVVFAYDFNKRNQ